MDTFYDPLWLKSAMEGANVGTGELAEESGISRSQIQRICNGAPPRLDTLRRLDSALKKLGTRQAAA